MKLISYRGNINGPNPEVENTIPYINDALTEGYAVSVDVWLSRGELYLCTKRPQLPGSSRSRGYRTGPPYYKVSEQYLENNMILVQAGTPETLARLAKNGRIHCFYVSEETAVTSRGLLWTTKDISGSNVLRVNLEGSPMPPCYAVCSNHIRNYGRPDPDQAILIPQKVQQIREMREQESLVEQEIAELEASLGSRRKELARKYPGLLKQIQRRLDAISELLGGPTNAK
tara:strand:+ start:96 stop:782 length:687 start_codon:yes stop_codon:yes gene_type:complete